ncbi:polymorphic toxin-type HINT domain-containing protein [Mycolicibacterium mageritense]|uniref:polymorphic toxin-type HINT domain-containing protein n=1 Tax=Mycolicibacterium mageritense TaxID=53462 RepID=UPI0023F1CF79|nr:polymorphic toxin-type HINT domain-containing protein [Mycolicibacterium mageritense]
MWAGWPARWLAVLCAFAVTVAGLHLVTGSARQGDREIATIAATTVEGFAEAAGAAFADSAVGSDPSLTAEQRRAGLPADPVAGLTSQTPAGLVQVVLPGGLGAAHHTSGGQVVYPDAGAGFDLLAENTATGTRTVAKVDGPGGVRMVTTFVRTPADTVMLAHTNGYLTINKATPAAETIGMFSPAETRDATGKLVPSSYVVKQVAPQLYALAEVFDPQPGTTWPVYVDPPLHLTGPLPQGFFDSVTNAVSSVADTVTSAASTAVSATVSGAKAVGTFVKENPLESAMLVGGVALALTGVGGPASAAMIASATVNLASATVDIAAAAMPDNQALGIASDVLGAASMVTPQGAAKKVVKEGAELAAQQLAKHADDVVDVAKAVPTPPSQLADDITASAAAAKPPVTPGVSPKAPNAPPAKSPELPCAGQSFSPDTAVLLADGSSRPIAQLGVGDLVWSTDPASGQSGPQLVQAVLVNHDTDLLDLTITNAAGESSVINTTSGHPFYSTTRAHESTRGLAASTSTAAYGPGWTDARNLTSGDGLYTPNNVAAQVKSTTPVAGVADMWDLTIENTHTFYITTPTASVLVHNCPAGPDLPVPDAAQPKPATDGKDITPKVKDHVTADRVSKSPDGNLRCENPHCAERVFRQEGRTRKGDKVPPNRAQFDHDTQPKSQGGTGGANGEDTKILCVGCNGPAGKGDKTPEEWAAAQEEVGRRSRERIQEHIRVHGEPPDGVIRTPNLRPQAAARNGQAQSTTQASAAQRRDTAIGQAREANNAPSQGNTGSAGTKSKDGGKKKSEKKKSGKKKDKTKKKNKKSKQNHKKPK